MISKTVHVHFICYSGTFSTAVESSIVGGAVVGQYVWLECKTKRGGIPRNITNYSWMRNNKVLRSKDKSELFTEKEMVIKVMYIY